MTIFLSYTAILVVAVLVVQAERRRRARELKLDLQGDLHLTEDERLTAARMEANAYLVANKLQPRYTDAARFIAATEAARLEREAEAEAEAKAKVEAEAAAAKKAFYDEIAARAALKHNWRPSSERIQ